MFEGYFREALRVIEKRLKGVLRELIGYFKGLSMEVLKSKDVSRMCQGCFKEL